MESSYLSRFAMEFVSLLEKAQKRAYLMKVRKATRDNKVAAFLRQGDGEPGFDQIFKSIKNTEGWLSRDEALLLYLLAKCEVHDAVEIGSYCGKSSIAIAAGLRDGLILHAVDPHTGDRSQVEAGMEVDTWSAFLANLKKAGVDSKVNPIRSFSVSAAREFSHAPVGMMFIDGWHDTDAVLEDFLFWRPFLNTEFSTIIFDDYTFRPVLRAIIALRDHLPPVFGAIGKDLVFRGALPARISA
jgi:predicted O-methyltransferase YrrM